ncbi:ComEA family DNA-binding protein [Nakamurella flava]|uniref:ComEA family DNA-binding protein n=1 Tax=Nakamurella flava TaxID=2576308 RepID=UPI0014085734|nr:ComEA family DNA-binding protein [Nakamurella flava]
MLLRRRFARSAELWVPQALQGARVDPGRRGLMALLLVAALAASITAVGVWRDRPQPASSATVSVVAEDPATDRVTTSPSGPPSSDPVARTGTLAATETTANAEIIVSVTGLVIRPGVVTLPAGSRVAAAIDAAGGLAPAADVTGLNLAARLDDGASVIVTGTGGAVSGAGAASDATGSFGSAGPGGARIDLNSADVTELDTLPGVGPVMAGNIVAWREQNGPFTSIEQLQEISGIGPARYAQLAELVVVA